MKLLKSLALVAFAATAMLAAPFADAQTPPINGPVYIPNQVIPPVTLTAPGDYYFNANGVASASVRVSGLSGTLVAVIQGSNDPYSVVNGSASWTTLQYIPVGGGAVANSISGNGFFFFNTGGLTRFRVHVTTLTSASHTVTLLAAGTSGTNGIYIMNPQAVSGPVGIIGTDGVSTLDCAADGSCESNLTRVNGAAVATGSGTSTGALRVELPTNGTGVVGVASDYPAGATPLTASATGTTGATTATLAGTTGKTTYICGFSIMTSATSAAVVGPTVTGTITGTLTMSQYVPAATAGVNELKREFNHCVPASATNTGIAVVSGAAGTGGVTAVNAWGYQL